MLQCQASTGYFLKLLQLFENKLQQIGQYGKLILIYFLKRACDWAVT
jgi:hypothetical protein